MPTDASAPAVPAGVFASFVAALYRAAGLPDEDAAVIADSFVTADLWGHSSHGVMRAPWYLARLQAGAMRSVTEPVTVVDAGAISVIDGRDGVGQVIAKRAVLDAVARAKHHGVGIVSVRESNHHGALGYYTRMAAERGCIGMLVANGSPAMAPWGGRAKVVGSNPWSIAAPAGRHAPLMLDIANTAVARGKIFLARQKGLPIPQGWALDAEGRATTDPVAALSSSGMLTEVAGPYQAERRSRSGHFVMALDIAAFGPLDAYETRIERMIAELKATLLAEGAAEILYPGELEAGNETRHRRDGLHLPDKTRADLLQWARELGLPPAEAL